ncbi:MULTISPECIES: hypothetical protein [unclassified Imperialibacter]|nr:MULTISPECIES: hypothetical protein [unclassified Imperialibacter]
MRKKVAIETASSVWDNDLCFGAKGWHPSHGYAALTGLGSG